MKRNLPFLLLLTVLACVDGYLLSKINIIGRLGINTVYHEYSFLKVWWKAGGLVLAVWLILFAVHSALGQKLTAGRARIVHIAGLVLALCGLYLTYHDFRTDITHRLLGSRFHTGGYMFWLGWISISIFCLAGPKRGDRNSEMQVERR